MTQPVELVLFDFDGVVVDSEIISLRMLVAELADKGVSVDLPYVARHFLGRSYPTVIAQVREEFGIALPEGFEADYRARLLAAFESEGLKVMPHLREVLETLAVPYCLATSSSPGRVVSSLALTGLTEAFEGRITTASEVKRGKPAPDLPLRAAEKAGVAPERCLLIEDSLAGIGAGLAAGMSVWQFTGGSHLAGGALPEDPEVVPHRQFASFAELPHLAPDLFITGT
ncbi:HAD family hydrolase [Alloyangia pacifica]|uniref:Haloacid dehalogenase superfamily, subfamily IA, variant 3 with third motif having DD or ED n=1 Tax=Alloyangia pacifica TaxID=311180 RepID=A0A1I6PAV0_9RHOB|nr:HAD-IA family hydrolase [Alloyangia pacifica]SDG23385.1 haloacid dehalogenase superfamily, subfamily IA, variant 3 with third motif having DD or ED [Alloyangia pacifica]SFS37260.1 haloacid dehalogenase superfamily, subfamily IA, variant 3 with third motif having DD or ED [Alloyangia pacifica]